MGHKPLITTLYPSSDPFVDNDVVFGVKKGLIKDFDDPVAVFHDFIIAPDPAFTDITPLDYVPNGSASNFEGAGGSGGPTAIDHHDSKDSQVSFRPLV